MDACLTVATQSACLLTFCQSVLHVCWCCAFLSAIPAGMTSHYQSCLPVVSHFKLCLLVWCLTISHVCLYSVSLSALALSAGMVSHYQPCLLVWCFIIGHAFWFSTSLSAMPVGVVPHYRPCLLACYLTLGHACWSVFHFNPHFDKLSADGRGVATSLVLLLQRCYYIRHVC